jgi:hypothetical protein
MEGGGSDISIFDYESRWCIFDPSQYQAWDNVTRNVILNFCVALLQKMQVYRLSPLNTVFVPSRKEKRDLKAINQESLLEISRTENLF